MKQLLQNLHDGKTTVTEVPIPSPRPGSVVIRTAASLVSAGTERMLVEFAEKSLIGKARSRPDLVRQMIDKARREGLLTTLDAAFNRLDQPMPLGYSSAGTIVAVGSEMDDFQVGDRVACAGGNFAVHAEYAVIPKNLLVRLPDNVDFESAAFTTLGAIALHGFRLARPQVGESVAIIGLGLLGLLSVEIANAAGCSVFGVDLDPRRNELGRQLGATAVSRDEAEQAAMQFTSGHGFDVVLICADTHSNDPLQLAGALARDRAQVIAVGAVGLNIPRKIYYEKEINFQVSRSYGPGRYDPAYEEGGRDYPIGYVRWTENRNMQSIVDLLATEKMDVTPLITHRFPIEEAPNAYELITGKTKAPFLGVLLTYDQSNTELPASPRRVDNQNNVISPSHSDPKIGVLGAGNYASAVFLPAIVKVGGAARVGIATASGLSARHASQKFGFSYATSSEEDLIADPNIDTLVILTRHHHHARQVQQALQLGKHVYCEKPLAINPQELEAIEQSLAQAQASILMVGFNRRFAPLAIQMKSFLQVSAEPLVVNYRVNAGFLPLNHWTQDPDQGGGRIIGEGCHFIDFLTFLVGESPKTVSAVALPDNGKYKQDNVILTFTYPNGSIGTVTYLANGDKSFPKERVEVFRGGLVSVLDDFRTLEMVKNGRRQAVRSRLSQDKGHRASWAAFLKAIRETGTPPIPYDQLSGVTLSTFASIEALSSGLPVTVSTVQSHFQG